MAVPQAVVQLVVTDYTGAQDGPFNLGPAKACPKVPNVVPTPKAKTKPKKQEQDLRQEARLRLSRDNSEIVRERNVVEIENPVRARGGHERSGSHRRLTLAVPAAAGAVTLIGSGLERRAAVHAGAVQGLQQDPPQRSSSSTSPTAATPASRTSRPGRSQFAINTRPPLPSDAGTTYEKLFLDGLCIAVNKANSISNISLTALKNIFLGVDTNWSQVARLEPVDHDRPDRA